MTSIEIKICGLSDESSIDCVIDGDVRYAGFIFFEKSPRNIGFEQAASLSAHIDGRIEKVAVCVNANDGELAKIVEALEPQILQLHGKETAERVNDVKQKFGLPVWKAFPIKDEQDLISAQEYKEVADRFLFDAKAPEGSELPGGNGVQFDWNLLNNFQGTDDYILSGGLDAGNIIEAIEQTGAKAVDISSGVESAPGIKDIAKITSFIKTIKEFEKLG